jgi:hypothetical protein
MRVEIKFQSAKIFKLLWLTMLGRGSLSFDTPGPMARAAGLVVALILPDASIELVATVVRSVPRVSGAGFTTDVRFAAYSPETRSALERMANPALDCRRSVTER